MVMEGRERHSVKAYPSILVIEGGMFMEVRELQPRNVLLVDYQYFTL